MTILSNQKKEFPAVYLIISDRYNSETVFLQISSWSDKDKLKDPYFGNSFYKCDKKKYDYLKSVFERNNKESYFWIKDNNNKFYFPIEKENKRIVLLFSKYERYGKIGS